MKFGRDVKTMLVEFVEVMSSEEKSIEFCINTLQKIAEDPNNFGYPNE